MGYGVSNVFTAAFVLATGTTAAIPANAADNGITRNAAPPASPVYPAAPPAIGTRTVSPVRPESTRAINPPPPIPVSPALAPATRMPSAGALAPLPERGAAMLKPVLPAVSPGPDYAVVLESQQELANTAIHWHFRVKNNGLVAPSVGMARLEIIAGNPCPGATIASEPLSILGPGASQPLSFRMPDFYAGKGCLFQARIMGLLNDSNPANNTIKMLSKKTVLPDLRIGQGIGSFVSDGSLSVINDGNGPAGPSKFYYECWTTDLDKSCGKYYEDRKPNVIIDITVPALLPGKSFEVTNFTPKGLPWKAYADVAKQIAESNEGNNTKFGGP